MNAQQKSPPRETQGLPGLFAASRAGRPHASFYCHSFCGPAHLQHIVFLFSIEKEKRMEKTKIQRAAANPREAKTCARKTCPKLCLHNVALYNSSKGKAVCETHSKTCGLYKDIM
jgi:hypothetical protein